MKLIKNIVAKEGIDSRRLQPYLSQSYSIYYLNYTLGDTKYPGCTDFDSGTKYYRIIFPFDSFITDTIEITTYAGYRYPMKIDIQGTGDRQNFVHLAHETAAHICSTYSTNPTVDCLNATSMKVKIPKDVYKGFKIVLDGNDIQGTYQLCIGKFEIYGSFVKERNTCKQRYNTFKFRLLAFILITK